MHHMQSVSPKHSPMHHTLTPLVPHILPISVISAKQTHSVKGGMLHSGHIGIMVQNSGTYLNLLVLKMTSLVFFLAADSLHASVNPTDVKC